MLKRISALLVLLVPTILFAQYMQAPQPFYTNAGHTVLFMGTMPPGSITPSVTPTPTNTPTNTFTPTLTPVTSSPNAIMIGKSLGTGVAVTVTPAISGANITIVHTAHGYSSGDYIALIDITASPTPQYALDALVPIGTVTTNTYTVPAPGSGTVGGPGTEMFWFKGSRSLNIPKIFNITRSAGGEYVGTFLNTQSDTSWGALMSGTSGAFTVSGCAPVSQTTTGFQTFCWSSTNGTDLVGGFEMYFFGIQ